MESPDAVGERFRSADGPAERAAALGVDLPRAARASARLHWGLIAVFAAITVAVVVASGVGGDGFASLLTLVLAFVAFVAVVFVVAIVRGAVGAALARRVGMLTFQVFGAVVLIAVVASGARLAAVLWPGNVAVMAGVVLASSFALTIDALNAASVPSLISRGDPSTVEVVRSFGADVDTVTTLGGRWKTLLADTAGMMVIGALLAYASWSSVTTAIVATLVIIAANLGAITAHRFAGTRGGLVLTWATAAAVAAIAALL